MKSDDVIVSFRGVRKTYDGETLVVKSLDLDIHRGEFLTLLGPSGSGKTTCLMMLAGFEFPTGGEIRLDGELLNNVPPHKRNIGMVFQNYALFPHMTVGENVAFALRARREPKAGWARRVADALAMVELGGYEQRRIASLSGGQRQRVALARAMVFEPQLILMDEPLSALDKQLRETMQIELRRLHRRLGATIIYVTHDQREALTMSDRVAVLRNGKLVQIDTPERLYDRPCNAFVASFIGEATLLPVTRAGEDMVRLGDSVLRASAPLPHADTLLLAVQTEKLVIADAGTPSTTNRLSARVTEVLYQGESLRVFATLPDGTALSLRQPGNHEARQRIPAPGAMISVALDPRDTIVVPA